MKTKSTDNHIKLILAKQQIQNLVSLFVGNEYESYIYSKLISIECEVNRQLSHYNLD